MKGSMRNRYVITAVVGGVARCMSGALDGVLGRGVEKGRRNKNISDTGGGETKGASIWGKGLRPSRRGFWGD